MIVLVFTVGIKRSRPQLTCSGQRGWLGVKATQTVRRRSHREFERIADCFIKPLRVQVPPQGTPPTNEATAYHGKSLPHVVHAVYSCPSRSHRKDYHGNYRASIPTTKGVRQLLMSTKYLPLFRSTTPGTARWSCSL